MEITRVDLEKKMAQFEQEAQTYLANYHRLSGAAAGIRELIKQADVPTEAPEE